MLPLKCLVICVILSSTFSAKTTQNQLYNFNPESRMVEINENDNIYVGFSQIYDRAQFTHCYIQSDTYIADYNLLDDQDTGNNLTDLSQRFFTNEDRGECGFKYYSANENTPIHWILTAYDSISQQNYTEKVTISFYYNMALYSTHSIVLSSGASANFFYNGNVKLKNCQIALYNNQLVIDLDMSSMNFIKHDNLSSAYLSSIGGGKCGYKLTNITNYFDISLLATDDQNRIYKNSSKITIAANNFSKDRINEVHLGDSTNIICGKETDSSDDSDQKFCHLYNPQGVLMSHDHMCDYSLEIVTLEDLGIWRCIVGFDYIMETLEFTTELQEKKRESVEAILEEGDEFFYILGCQLVNFNSMTISYCIFTRPDGTMYKVVEGGTTTYYNTFTADLNNGRCSLEIVKPLREEDKGTWKCEAFTAGFGLVGTLINVTKSTTVSYINGIKKTIHLGSSFVVDCVVPYSSNVCHVIAPNGTEYEPDTNLRTSLSLCILTIEHATESDHGTWSCSIGQNNGIPDEIITMEISIIEKNLFYADAEATENEEVELVCSTSGIPIEYCRFVDPAGQSYSLRNTNSTNNKISYTGRGLKYGDCGLKISGVESTNNGIWTCHISSGRTNKATLKSEVKLTVLPVSSEPIIAESVGIAGGLLIILTVLGGIVFYKYADRIKCSSKKTNQVENPTRNSSGSTGSTNLKNETADATI